MLTRGIPWSCETCVGDQALEAVDQQAANRSARSANMQLLHFFDLQTGAGIDCTEAGADRTATAE